MMLFSLVDTFSFSYVQLSMNAHSTVKLPIWNRMKIFKSETLYIMYCLLSIGHSLWQSELAFKMCVVLQGTVQYKY